MNYPSLDFLFGLRVTPRYMTVAPKLMDGARIRRQLWAEPLHSISGSHKLTDAQYSTLDGFFRTTAKGIANSFTLTDPATRVYTDVYLGTGDGAETDWDVPAKSISDYTFYVNGVEVDEGSSSDYTISATGGTDGRAQLNLNITPSAGYRVSADFTGQRAWTVVFANDDLQFRILSDGIEVRVDFEELRAV